MSQPIIDTKTYQEFQAEIDKIDAEIKRRRHDDRSTELLEQIRQQIIRDWQEPPES